MNETEAKPVYGYHSDKQALVKRLHRIEKMVEYDRYCIDILPQLGAVTTALERLRLQPLGSHLSHCVAGALAPGDEQDAEVKTRELLQAARHFAKTR